ncbi:hypothetical protein AA313_de0207721 [Arthrobotrys entomopaga]|nr:hypothetical protein AA313_de0207721 [Arthrobotrys entomopaga]
MLNISILIIRLLSRPSKTCSVQKLPAQESSNNYKFTMDELDVNITTPPKTRIETLPLELQEQILGYVLHPGPQADIIIRNALVLEEENHFNVLPKNPPHPFARHTCTPKHKRPFPSTVRRRECHNADYKVPVRLDGLSLTHTYGLSLTYQLSPIPQNVLCVSKSFQRAVESVWGTYRRCIKKLLDSQMVLKGKNNDRKCGSYTMIWYTDFIADPSREMLDFVREKCRLVMDIETSIYAVLSTMNTAIIENISNIAIPYGLVLDPDWFGRKFGRLLNPLKSVGVIAKDGGEVPIWCIELLEDWKTRAIEFIQPIKIKKKHEVQDFADGSEVDRVDPGIVIPDSVVKASLYMVQYHRLTSQEIHDRGRYVFNTFKQEDGCYFQGRQTFEDTVHIIKIELSALNADSGLLLSRSWRVQRGHYD